MSIWIHAVDMIPIKCKRRSGLHCAFDNQPDNVFNRNDSLFNPIILHTVQIFFFPRFSITVFQRIALHRQNLVRTHQIPVSLDIVSCLLPKIIRVADRREHIMRLHPVIPIICSQIQKLRQISVPHIKINCNCPLAHTKLINCDRRVVCKTNPTYHTSCCPLKSSDSASACPHFSKIHSHSSTKFTYFGKIIDTSVNSI